MFNATAKAALKLAEKTSVDFATHVALCNEFHRQAAEQRTTLQVSLSALQRDLSDVNSTLQDKVAGLRGYFVRILLGIGGAAFFLVLTAFGAVAMFLLQHIDRLAQ